MKIGKLLLRFIGLSMSRSEERGLKGVVFDKSENTIFNIP